jgi:acid phosphatase family membrane protein YuiD
MIKKFYEVVGLSRLAGIQIKVLGKLVENLRISPEKVQVKEILGTFKLVFL